MRRIGQPLVKFERRIPVAVILTLLVQMGGALIWAAQLDARVDSIEIKHVDDRHLNEKFARLEERLDFLKQDIGGMKHQLAQLTDKLIRGR